jgi:hypothetical protein
MLRNCAFVAMPLRDAVEKVLGAWVMQVLLGSFDCGGKKRRLPLRMTAVSVVLVVCPSGRGHWWGYRSC